MFVGKDMKVSLQKCHPSGPLSSSRLSRKLLYARLRHVLGAKTPERNSSNAFSTTSKQEGHAFAMRPTKNLLSMGMYASLRFSGVWRLAILKTWDGPPAPGACPPDAAVFSAPGHPRGSSLPTSSAPPLMMAQRLRLSSHPWTCLNVGNQGAMFAQRPTHRTIAELAADLN